MKSKIFNFFLVAGFAGSLVLGVTSCGDEEEKLPPIDGYNSSDEVASTNLLAHWPFENDSKEKKSGVAASKTVSASFDIGAKGKGLKLTDGYLLYDGLSAKLAEIKTDLSISVWANVSNNQGTSNPHATSVVMLTGGANITASTGPLEGCSAVMLETAHFRATSDTLRVKSLIGVKKASGDIGSEDNVNWWGLDNIKNPGQMVRTAGKMAHYVLVWDNTAKTINLYVDGVLATNPEWQTKTGANFQAASNMKVIVGGFMNNAGITSKTEDWAKPLSGIVDEIRIYNKALSVADIGSLYKLEKAGR